MECVNLDPNFHKFELIVTLSKEKRRSGNSQISVPPASEAYHSRASHAVEERSVTYGIDFGFQFSRSVERNNSRLSQWDASHSPFWKTRKTKGDDRWLEKYIYTIL